MFLLDGAPGRIDQLTCTLQLLYEVHDPARYITPDVILDLTGVRFEEIGRNRVRVTGARRAAGRRALKVSGFVEAPGFIADVEIGYAGTGALNRGRVAADTLRLRLADLPRERSAHRPRRRRFDHRGRRRGRRPTRCRRCACTSRPAAPTPRSRSGSRTRSIR